MAVGTKWSRRLRTTLLVTAAACGLVVGGWCWVVPALAKEEARLFLADFWTGPVEIDGLSLELNGVTKVGSIRLLDEDGREWARMENVTFTPKNWPSLEAAAAKVTVGSAVVRVHVAGGEVSPPMRRPTQPLPESFVLEELTLAAATDTGLEKRWGPLSVSVSRKESSYRVGARSLRIPGDEALTVDGTVEVGSAAMAARMSGRACGGAVAATLDAGLDQAGVLEYTASVKAGGVDVDLLAKHFLQAAVRPGGRLRADWKLHGLGTSLKDLECTQGSLWIRGVNLAKVATATSLLCTMGLPQDNALAIGSVECRFTSSGSRLVFQKVEATTALSAVMIEPGGSIDWLSREVSLYLVGTPLRHLSGALSLLGPAGGLKDSLTRIRVKGRWDQPAEELIQREGVEDLTSSTLGLLETVVEAASSLRSVERGVRRSAESGPASRPAGE